MAWLPLAIRSWESVDQEAFSHESEFRIDTKIFQQNKKNLETCHLSDSNETRDRKKGGKPFALHLRNSQRTLYKPAQNMLLTQSQSKYMTSVTMNLPRQHIGVQRGVSKRVLSGVACSQRIEGLGIAGPGEILWNPWQPLALRLCSADVVMLLLLLLLLLPRYHDN
jgi:hypothetical protein